jgi:hypothetical protein
MRVVQAMTVPPTDMGRSTFLHRFTSAIRYPHCLMGTNRMISTTAYCLGRRFSAIGIYRYQAKILSKRQGLDLTIKIYIAIFRHRRRKRAPRQATRDRRSRQKGSLDLRPRYAYRGAERWVLQRRATGSVGHITACVTSRRAIRTLLRTTPSHHDI